MGEVLVSGRCDEGYGAVRDAFQENFRQGKELGASFALTVDGEMVVDLWGGYSDRERTKPWQEDTLVPVMSCSKTMCALCGLFLVDRGLIDLDAPIAKYWPEFGAAGKENIPTRYAFYHATGVAGLKSYPTTAQYKNWDWVINEIANEAPWFTPGERSGYHIFNFGFILGELVRRTTGLSIGQFFAKEIAARLDADFFIGLPETDLARLAEVDFDPESHAGEEPSESGHYERITEKISQTIFFDLEDPEWLGAEMPSSNGIANARGLARAGTILAVGGTLGGERFLSEETCKLPYQEQIYTLDHVIEERVRFGLGYGINSPEFPLPFEDGFHWGGYGGSIFAVAPHQRLCWAYTPNLYYGGLPADPRNEALTNAVAVVHGTTGEQS